MTKHGPWSWLIWMRHSPRRPAVAIAANVLFCLSVLFAFGLVVTVSFSPVWSFWEQRIVDHYLPFSNAGSKASPEPAAGSSHPLLIPLHPEDHIHRPPRTTTLEWTITAGLRHPDGMQKRVYLVNGQFPGPTIEARSGDDLVIHVHNQLNQQDRNSSEGLSLHWHGLRMRGLNHMDGAVGITQCPIAPGSSFTYRVHIDDDEHGTFWWHSHAAGQRSDGLLGGLIIHEPESANAKGSTKHVHDEVKEKVRSKEDKAVIPQFLVMLGDWFHSPADDVLDWFTSYHHFGSEPVPESLLINGRGRFDCGHVSAAFSDVPCHSPDGDDDGSEHPLAFSTSSNPLPSRSHWRVINVGSLAGVSLAAPWANFTPLAVDGGAAVAPVSGRGFGTLYPGERVDVLVTEEGGEEGRRVHVLLDPENLVFTNPSLQQNQSFPVVPGKTTNSSQDQVFTAADFVDLADLKALAPVPDAPHWPATAQAQHTLALYTKVLILTKYGNTAKGYINHTSWQPQYPPLLVTPRQQWNADQFVPFIATDTDSDSAPWVDLVINNLDDGAHPFHMHGHSFYVLSRHYAEYGDWGSYNPFEDLQPPSPVDLSTPLRKDTVAVPSRGHVVMRFRADNPGLWMMHCHMYVHAGSGMSLTLHVGSSADANFTAGANGQAAALCR